MVPEGWSIKKLGEVGELQRGFDLPKEKRKKELMIYDILGSELASWPPESPQT